jgi:purine nucleosidase
MHVSAADGRMTEPATHSVVVDTDGGTDDAVALWWLLTHPRIELAAIIVTWGNVDRDAAATNVCRILRAAGRPEVPVALGAAEPIGPTPLPELATFVHGDDGLGGFGDRWSTEGVEPTDELADAMLSRLTSQREGDIDLLVIGTLSTLARALDDDPGVASRARSLTVMAGAVRPPGNALPFGESNIAHDPEAAAAVVTAPWPTPPLLVGLDVTLRAVLWDDDIDLATRGRTAAGRFLADPLRAYADFYARSRQTQPRGFACHDLLAAQAIVEPEVILDAPTVPLAIDTGRSAAWGATIADLRATHQFGLPGFAPWRVALDVDAERFRAAFRSLVA